MSEGIGIPIPDPPEPDEFIPAPFPTPPAPPAPAPEPEPEPTPEPTPVPEPVPLPPEPGTPGGMPGIDWIAALLVILGLIALITALVDFFNWLARFLLGPFYNRSGSPSLTPQTMLQPLSNALGKWEANIDKQLGLSFTQLGQLTGRVGSAIVAAEATTYQAILAIRRLEARLAQQQANAAKTGQQVRHAQATASRAAVTAQTTSVEAARRDHQQQGQLDTLTHHVSHVIEPELDALRHRIPDLEKGTASAWDLLKQHDELLGAAGVVASTAYGLARLGASWTRCENNQNIGRALCGPTGSGLAKLLEGGLPLLAFTDICAVVKAGTELVESGPIQHSLSFSADAIAGLLSCTSSEVAAPLNSAYYAPGPLTELGSAGTLNV